MIRTSRLLRHVGRTPELFDAWRQTPAWLNVTRQYLEIGEPAYPCRIPLSAGGSVVVNGPEELKVFWQIFVRRCYALPTRCETILDAGANVGLFAVWAAKERPAAKIVSLEPFPKTFQSLERNVHQNGLQHRIRPVQCALAAETGERLIQGDAESPNSRLIARDMENSESDAIAVPCFTLVDCLTAERLETVDLLKMDIEGSEWEVILSTSGEVLRRFRHIILEYHEVHASLGYAPTQLFSHLSSAGYRLTHHEEDTQRTGLASFSLC